LSAHSLTNASYSGSRSRFILIGMPQIGERCVAWTAEISIHAPKDSSARESFPPIKLWEKALAGSERNLGLASALPYVSTSGPTRRVLKKRKDFPMMNPLRRAMCLTETVPSRCGKHRSFIGGEREAGHSLK
jgi:hypothetical protein